MLEASCSSKFGKKHIYGKDINRLQKGKQRQLKLVLNLLVSVNKQYHDCDCYGCSCGWPFEKTNNWCDFRGEMKADG